MKPSGKDSAMAPRCPRAPTQVFTDINPLAFPRGQEKTCELCPLPARFACHTCNRAFYCSEKHRSSDAHVIHKDICHLLSFVRTPPDFSQDNKTRERIEKQKKIRKLEIMDMAYKTAKRSLCEMEPSDAIAQVTHSLRFANQLFGPVSVETIPYHLVMREAYSKLGQEDKATTCMSSKKNLPFPPLDVMTSYPLTGGYQRLEYILDEVEFCPATLKADFYKNRGDMYLSQGDLEEAMTNYAQETYYASEAYDTEHTRTASGFFHLGKIFHKVGNTIKAYWLFLHTVDIWYTRLNIVADDKTVAMKDQKKSVFLVNKADKTGIGFEESTEAWEALNFIYRSMVEEGAEVPPSQVIKICYSVALYYYITDQPKKALGFVSNANSVVTECPAMAWEDKLKTLTRRCQRLLY